MKKKVLLVRSCCSSLKEACNYLSFSGCFRACLKVLGDPSVFGRAEAWTESTLLMAWLSKLWIKSALVSIGLSLSILTRVNSSLWARVACGSRTSICTGVGSGGEGAVLTGSGGVVAVVTGSGGTLVTGSGALIGTPSGSLTGASGLSGTSTSSGFSET